MGFPRTRGDGPPTVLASASAWKVSPHTRGWTLAALHLDALGVGFPAHAGMDPSSRPPRRSGSRFPRTRGDGPRSDTVADWLDRVSPHTRGWTPRRLSPVSPGWGFPAHAGMDRVVAAASRRPNTVSPHTRGWTPMAKNIDGAAGEPVSPHTRGWTLGDQDGGDGHRGFPAHAGMDLSGGRRSGPSRSRFPRTRGDGPGCLRLRSETGEVSPHTRGWTPQAWRRPAHAGMDP